MFKGNGIVAAVISPCIALMGLMSSPDAVLAQGGYPNRLVKIIVPYDPGTGPDILARTIGQKLGENERSVGDREPRGRQHSDRHRGRRKNIIGTASTTWS